MESHHRGGGFLEWSPSRRQKLVKTRNKFVTTNRRNCLSHRSGVQVHPGDTPADSINTPENETKEDSAYFPINFSSRGSSSARKHYVTHDRPSTRWGKTFPMGQEKITSPARKNFSQGEDPKRLISTKAQTFGYWTPPARFAFLSVRLLPVARFHPERWAVIKYIYWHIRINKMMLSWRQPVALKERRGSRQNFYPSEWSFFPACTILSQNVLVCVCVWEQLSGPWPLLFASSLANIESLVACQTKKRSHEDHLLLRTWWFCWPSTGSSNELVIGRVTGVFFRVGRWKFPSDHN